MQSISKNALRLLSKNAASKCRSHLRIDGEDIMSIRARLRRLERLAPAQRKDRGPPPLEQSLAELRRIEQWLSAHGYKTAEQALNDGATGFESRWGSLHAIAEIDKMSERLLLEERSVILGTVTCSGPA
jgi:hypothetical protein